MYELDTCNTRNACISSKQSRLVGALENLNNLSSINLGLRDEIKGSKSFALVNSDVAALNQFVRRQFQSTRFATNLQYLLSAATTLYLGDSSDPSEASIPTWGLSQE